MNPETRLDEAMKQARIVGEGDIPHETTEDIQRAIAHLTAAREAIEE